MSVESGSIIMEWMIFIDSLEQGLIYGIMALGVFISFRILDFPDLTVDSSLHWELV